MSGEAPGYVVPCGANDEELGPRIPGTLRQDGAGVSFTPDDPYAAIDVFDSCIIRYLRLVAADGTGDLRIPLANG